nr:hypothetical protein [Saccharibacillus sp. O23]
MHFFKIPIYTGSQLGNPIQQSLIVARELFFVFGDQFSEEVPRQQLDFVQGVQVVQQTAADHAHAAKLFISEFVRFKKAASCRLPSSACCDKLFISANIQRIEVIKLVELQIFVAYGRIREHPTRLLGIPVLGDPSIFIHGFGAIAGITYTHSGRNMTAAQHRDQ